MPRPTRRQVQEQNRATVLEVARRSFLRDGYVATSLASVAADAGFTTGIVYSGFGSKAELAFAVLADLQAEQIAALAAGVQGAASLDEVVDSIRTWAVAATASGWVRFELELLLDTFYDRRFAAVQADRQAAAVRQVGEVWRALVPVGTTDDETVDVVAEATVDYAIGVAIRQVTNRAASPERFLQLVRPLLEAYLAR